MRTLQVKALLDRPSPKSMGMLGLVVDDKDRGMLRTEGIVGKESGSISIDDLESLVTGGHAVRVTENIVSDTTEGPLVALWTGNDFLEQAEIFNLPLPPLPSINSSNLGSGTFWIAPARHAWLVIDAWISQAFRRVVSNPNDGLASLMTWASADRDEARAATWLTSTSEKREKDLRWWSKIEADRGNEVRTPAILENQFKGLVEMARRPPANVIGFCALAKGGDNEIANLFATKEKIRRVSFGGWLRRTAVQRGEESNRQHLQRMGEDMLRRRGALAFCLEVLSDINATVPVDAFVIDGIRHLEVLTSLRCLIGEDRFKLASVFRPEADRRRLLMKEEFLSAEVVDRVLNDTTEAEIPEVQRKAEFSLSATSGPEEAGDKLLRLLGA